MSAPSPLLVCYVPGLDRRRLETSTTPFVCEILRSYPSMRLRTQPTTELFPTLITGVNPHEHQVWQVSLRQGTAGRPADRWLDGVPDWLTTTLQCFHHAWDPAYDLPAIPYRRRRQFELHRFKYTRRKRTGDVVNVIGGVPSVFQLLGGKGRYRIVTEFRRIPGLLEELPDPRFDLDWLEFYAFDLLSHWNLDRAEVMRRHQAIVDRFVEGLAERCRRSGALLVLLVDHGQEQVRKTIDLREALRRSGVPREEWLEYVEVGIARFWFRTPRAREAIRFELRREGGLHLKSPEELRAYGIEFPDGRFGELYAIAEPGTIFFPHDFYHPLGNLYMGISKPALWRRILHPVHRGTHGQLPEHPAEEGYVVAMDRDLETVEAWAQLIDVAPTLMGLLDRPAAPTMRGRSFFRRRRTAP